MKYKAFISYSHKSNNNIAQDLQYSVETFARKWYQVRRFRIFRDESDLAVSPSLWRSISSALGDSEYLIYLASPQAASSKWAQKELNQWINNNGIENIIIVFTDGIIEWNDTANDFCAETSSSVPDALFGKYTDEPLHIDLSFAKDRLPKEYLNDNRYVDAIASINAALLKVDKSDLTGRIAKERKTRNLVTKAVSLMVSIFVLSTGYFWWNSKLTKQELVSTMEKAEKANKDAKDTLLAAYVTMLKRGEFNLLQEYASEVDRLNIDSSAQFTVTTPLIVSANTNKNMFSDEELWPKVYLNIIHKEISKKRYNQAISLFERAIGEHPDSTTLLSSYANFLAETSIDYR